MQPLIVLDTSHAEVEPGGESRLAVRIRNVGTIVEAYRLDVVGQPASWTTVEPSIVSVYPGQEADAEIVFAPPRTTGTPLGIVPFGVRAVSDIDPSQSIVAEGELEVGGVVDLAAKLLPRNSKGRWRGKHRVEIENNGNSPIRLGLSAADADEQLSFKLKTESLDIAAGDFAVAKIKAKIRSPFLRGPQTPRPFQVTMSELASDEISERRVSRNLGHVQSLDGVVGQRQIVGGSFVALTALIVLAVGGYFAYINLSDDPTTVGTETAQAVPRAPAGLTATALDSANVRLTWTNPTGDEQGFDVLELVDGASRTLQANVPRGDTTFEIADLEPDTEYCYALRAFNSVGRSDATEAVCTNTPTLTELPPPPAPAGIRITVSDDGTGDRVDLRWIDRTEDGAETIVIENGEAIASVPAGRTALELGRGPETYCYELRSVIDGRQSLSGTDADDNSLICVDVQEPLPTLEEGTIGFFIQLGTLVEIPEAEDFQVTDRADLIAQFTVDAVADESGQFDSTVLVAPDLTSGALDDIDQQLLSAQQNGHTGAIVVNGDHVGIPGGDNWVVIVPGFASRDAARSYCDEKGEVECNVLES